jgi:hexosaminidase
MRKTLPAIAVSMLVIAGCTPSSPAAGPAPSYAVNTRSVIPLPSVVHLDPSQVFRVDTSTTIYVDPTADSTTGSVAEYLREMLSPFVGQAVQRVTPPSSASSKRIRLSLDSSTAATSTDEGYTLDITPSSISIVAKRPAGLFYGVQTLRQLLPVSVEYPAALDRTLFVPTGHIEDAPRFEWRGFMLDVSRHFLPPRDVKHFIDLISMYKMNRLHLHLADNQGWRIDIKSRPNLAKIGGSTEVGGGPGGYFTQDEYKDIVQYAASRFITVVPEIDMPAHTDAALASYPELSCNRVATPLYTGIGAGPGALCVDSASTYPILSDIVREISDMTPGPYYHIGGDEVDNLTRAQYITFIERLQSIVSSNGKRMIGWADIAPANLSPNTIVQHWAGDSAQIQVRRGGKVIMSPGSHAYLDMKYDTTTILGLHWAGYLTQRSTYDWDPAKEIPGVTESSVLGVESPLWSETLVRVTDFEFLAFPRIISIAEVGWTSQHLRRWDDFSARLDFNRARLTALGVNAGH